jgi:hypothetical protein
LPDRGKSLLPKPTRPERLLSLLLTVALILCLYWLAACTPPPLIIQPTPVKEPVTSQPLPAPKPEGYFSHRLREILGQP